MYCETSAPCVNVMNDAQISLQQVDIHVRVVDYVARTTMTYRFVNAETVHTEVVYTFPLPVDGVLTSLTTRIGDTEMFGFAVEKQEALERYEDAVGAGDTPIMLERLDSGLYSLNVGNLSPGETASIQVEFVEILTRKDDCVRYDLPTTLAPWYGDPVARGLEQHQTPAHSLGADNFFRFSAQITGCLRLATLSCPSHGVAVRSDSETLHVSLTADLTRMDRDLVLLLQGRDLPSAFAVAAPAGASHVLMAGFTPMFSTAEAARSIKLVVDCSGSMSGESMLQAREAVLRILERLRPEDHFNIIRFGSDSAMLFNRQEPADERHVTAARAAVRAMDASMGGTEMHLALRKALGSASPQGMPEDVLLITDGQVWDLDEAGAELRSAGHRVFCIGVGSAVSAGILRSLSAATGGETTLVSPREDMGRRVFAQFKRMIMGKAAHAELLLDGRPAREFLSQPVPDVHAGDMVIAWARRAELPAQASLCVRTPDGEIRIDAPVTLDTGLAELLPRLEAHARLDSLPAEKATALAVEHNLASAYTHYLVVMERAEEFKAPNPPALRTVVHAVPHGWGGLGMAAGAALVGFPDLCAPSYIRTTSCFPHCLFEAHAPRCPIFWADKVLRRAEALVRDNPAHTLTYADLHAWGVPKLVIENLKALHGDPELQPKKAAMAFDLENCIAHTFLLALATHEDSTRNLIRVFRQARGKLPKHARLTDVVARLVDALA